MYLRSEGHNSGPQAATGTKASDGIWLFVLWAPMVTPDSHDGAKGTSPFRVFAFFAVFVALVSPAFAQTDEPARLEPGPADQVPRTPWGDPDLQGVWPGTAFGSVPLERPLQFGTRNELTDLELAARALQERNRREGFERDGALGPAGAPGHWLEWGSTQRQASLIVDPPDGRLPPMTPEAKARALQPPRPSTSLGASGPFNSPLDFTMWERCISRGVLGSTLPALYNSGIDITQGPGVVAIRYEMIHDHRVIPLEAERPLLSSSIRQYMGDARGHWEGETLVIETRNFNGRTGPVANGAGVTNSPGMVLTERFRRVSRDTMQYEATVRDPATWVAPWTVSFPLRLTPGYGMHEYACHEGNYGLRNALSAARAGER
jgi:hypothetical protein